MIAPIDNHALQIRPMRVPAIAPAGVASLKNKLRKKSPIRGAVNAPFRLALI